MFIERKYTPWKTVRPGKKCCAFLVRLWRKVVDMVPHDVVDVCCPLPSSREGEGGAGVCVVGEGLCTRVRECACVSVIGKGRGRGGLRSAIRAPFAKLFYE